MIILVTGGRKFADPCFVFETLDALNKVTGESPKGVTKLVQGGAAGADALAQAWATDRCIPNVAYPANWKHHGKQAGVIRNCQMLTDSDPDLVVAFPGGVGTAHMVKIAKQRSVPVFAPPYEVFVPQNVKKSHGDKFTIAEFSLPSGGWMFDGNDGDGYYGTDAGEVRMSIRWPRPHWATHIYWYNK